jgi:hypothetical protein
MQFEGAQEEAFKYGTMSGQILVCSDSWNQSHPHYASKRSLPAGLPASAPGYEF